MPDRKTELLETADSILRTKSFRAFSFQELADAVGIRKASVHHHFASKEALALALLDFYGENARRMMSALAESCEHRPGEMIRAFLAGSERVFVQGDCRVCPHGAFGVDADDLPEPVRSALSRLIEVQLSGLARLLDAAREAREVSFEGDSLDQARMMMATIQGARAIDAGGDPELFRGAVRQLASGLGLGDVSLEADPDPGLEPAADGECA